MDRGHAVGWLVAICLFVIGGGAEASPYTFSIVAQEGDVIDGREILGFMDDPLPVAINNDREVAFFAGVSWEGHADWAIMTERRFIAGAGKEVDDRVPNFNSDDHWLDINNAGQVAYTAPSEGFGRGLYVNETLVLEPGDVVDGRTLTLIDEQPAINDAGMIVFQSWYQGHAGDALFTQDRLLLEQGQSLDGYTLGSMAYPQINNHGDVVVTGALLELETFFKRGVFSPDGVILKPGDEIEGMIVEQIRVISDVTDSGDVVTTAIANTMDNTSTTVMTQDRVLFVPSGDFFDLAGSRVAFNKHQQLAVLGAIALEEGGFKRALSVDGEIILAEGDLLEGNLITRIYQNFDMNDGGDVAFRVEFEGEERPRAIILATVPEPATALILAVGAIPVVFLSRARRRQTRLPNWAIPRAINSLRRGRLLLPLVLLTASAESASAQGYQLEIVAQESDVIEGREILGFMDDPLPVAINNDREVAFFAGVAWEGNADWAIMTERRFIAGAGKEVDDRVPNFNSDDHWLDINNAGQVAYTAPSEGFGRGLYVNETLVLEPGDVVDGRTLTLIGEQPDINDTGTIVFESWYLGHAGPAIFTQDRLLVEQGQTLGGFTLGAVSFPQINNHGDVAISANLLELETQFIRGIISPSDVILKPGDTVKGMTIEQIVGLSGITEAGDAVITAITNSMDDTSTTTVMTQERTICGPAS